MTKINSRPQPGKNNTHTLTLLFHLSVITWTHRLNRNITDRFIKYHFIT